MRFYLVSFFAAAVFGGTLSLFLPLSSAFAQALGKLDLVCVVDQNGESDFVSLEYSACLEQGARPLPKNSQFKTLRTGIKAGQPAAEFNVATILRHDKALSKYRFAAVSWYQKSAKSGYRPALLALANLYESGDLLERDVTRAYSLYERVLDTDQVDTPRSGSQAGSERNITRLRETLTLMENELGHKSDVRQALEKELAAVRGNAKTGDALDFSITSAKLALNQKKKIMEKQRQQLTQKQSALQALRASVRSGANPNLYREQLSWLAGEVSAQKQNIEKRYQRIELRRNKASEIAARLNFNDKLESSAAVLALDESEQGGKDRVLKQYLLELEDSIQHRKTTTDRQKKKLDFLDKRIAKLKQSNARQIKPDDQVLLERALTELDSRYQGRLDFLATNLNGEKSKVSTLTTELAIVEQHADRKDALVDTITKRLDQATKLVDRQSVLVDQQSKDLQLAISSMNDAHKNQPRKQQSAKAMWKNDSALMAKPEIVITWPQNIDKGDSLVATPSAGSVLNVVGGVRVTNELEQLTVDGKPVELDKNNMFVISVDVTTESRTVELIAYAKNGEVSSRALRIVPSITKPLARQRLQAEAANLKDLNEINFGNYHALVIGNNNYQGTGFEVLDTAENDARSMAELLEKSYGFEVDLVLNATRDDTMLALERMRSKLSDNDNLLIFYAGHGIMDPESDQGYWVPVDGKLDSVSRWISNATITDQIRAMTARNVMVIADSCYSGSLMRSGVMYMRSGLTPEKKIRRVREDLNAATRVALSSGGLQPVIDSLGGSPNSVFTEALLKTLASNNALLDADSLATEVSHTVVMATKDNVRQVPRFAPLIRAGHEGGEFYFVPSLWRSPG